MGIHDWLIWGVQYHDLGNIHIWIFHDFSLYSEYNPITDAWILIPPLSHRLTHSVTVSSGRRNSKRCTSRPPRAVRCWKFPSLSSTVAPKKLSRTKDPSVSYGASDGTGDILSFWGIFFEWDIPSYINGYLCYPCCCFFFWDMVKRPLINGTAAPNWGTAAPSWWILNFPLMDKGWGFWWSVYG